METAGYRCLAQCERVWARRGLRSENWLPVGFCVLLVLAARNDIAERDRLRYACGTIETRRWCEFALVLGAFTGCENSEVTKGCRIFGRVLASNI